jgi:ABC-type nitrate/sulfonate/bicarbonate transport system substrate-binding protein
MQSLTVGNPAVGADLLMHVAKAKGFFEQNGVEVKIIDEMGSNIPNALVSGQIDIGLTAIPTALAVTQQGKQTSVIYGTGGASLGASLFGVPGKSETIAQLKAIKGCKIAAFPAGSNAFGEAQIYIHNLGLDCEVLPLPEPAAQLGAVVGGRADAVVGAYASFAEAVTAGKVVPIVDTRDPKQREEALGKDYLAVVLAGVKSDLEGKKEGIADFLKGLNEAYEFSKEATVPELVSLMSEFEEFSVLPPEAQKVTIESFLPFLLTSTNQGYITEPQWNASLEHFEFWEIPDFDPKAPEYSYEQAVDMSYYEAGIGKPPGTETK